MDCLIPVRTNTWCPVFDYLLPGTYTVTFHFFPAHFHLVPLLSGLLHPLLVRLLSCASPLLYFGVHVPNPMRHRNCLLLPCMPQSPSPPPPTLTRTCTLCTWSCFAHASALMRHPLVVSATSVMPKPGELPLLEPAVLGPGQGGARWHFIQVLVHSQGMMQAAWHALWAADGGKQPVVHLHMLACCRTARCSSTERSRRPAPEEASVKM